MASCAFRIGAQSSSFSRYGFMILSELTPLSAAIRRASTCSLLISSEKKATCLPFLAALAAKFNARAVLPIDGRAARMCIDSSCQPCVMRSSDAKPLITPAPARSRRSFIHSVKANICSIISMTSWSSCIEIFESFSCTSSMPGSPSRFIAAARSSSATAIIWRRFEYCRTMSA